MRNTDFPLVHRGFSPLFRELDEAFRGLSAEVPQSIRGVPGADVIETADALKVILDVPGYRPDALEVKFEDGTLHIHGERKSSELQEHERWLRRERTEGSFTRSFRLPPTVDGNRIEARFEHGVLTVVLPKREDTKPRRIEVKVQD
jgi:HSP20 family protein